MTVAVSKALEAGSPTGDLRVDREHGRVRRGLRGARRAAALSSCSRHGAVARGKLAQARALGARVLEVRGSFDDALAAAPRSPTAGRTCSSTRSTRTGSRARRRPRSRSSRSSARARRARAPVRRRRQHARLRARLRGGWSGLAADPRRRGRASAATTLASAIRIAEPAHAKAPRPCASRAERRVARRRGDPRGVARSRAARRASSASPRRRRASPRVRARGRARSAGRLRPHRPRAQGPRGRRPRERRRRSSSSPIRTRSPRRSR